MEPSGFCPACKQPLPADTPLGGVCPQCLLKSGFYSGTAPEPERREKFAAPAIADLAPHFPQLEIVELIGRGGMGAVYKARQPRLNRLVALKVLAREREADARFADRFLREAQALAQMNHPNIVTVHDFGEAGGHYYLVMEYVDGLNLRELEHSKKLTPEEALIIVPPICDALQYAHQQGIVHRDIKPENILIDKQGRVKIADFGIAKLLGVSAPDEPLTGEQQRVGTPLYMAPEQVEKPTTVDHRADIYSLGVVFYEMLTGELPIGRFAAPSQKVQIDVRLDEIVMRALEKEPALRYQQVSEIKTQMETLSTPAAPSQTIEPEAAPDRGALIIGAVVMLLMLAFGRNIVSSPETLTFWYIGFLTGLAVIVYRLFTFKKSAPLPKASGVQAGASAESDASFNAARSQLMAPAIGLIVSALLSLLPLLFIIPILISQVFSSRNMELSYAARGVVVGVPVLLVSAIAVFIIYGASNMLRVKSRGTGIAAAILAMITPPGLILGIPFGIWALVALGNERVRETFEAGNPRPPKQDPDGKDPVDVLKTPFPDDRSDKSFASSLWVLLGLAFFLMILQPTLIPSLFDSLRPETRQIIVWAFALLVVLNLAYRAIVKGRNAFYTALWSLFALLVAVVILFPKALPYVWRLAVAPQSSDLQAVGQTPSRRDALSAARNQIVSSNQARARDGQRFPEEPALIFNSGARARIVAVTHNPHDGTAWTADGLTTASVPDNNFNDIPPDKKPGHVSRNVYFAVDNISPGEVTVKAATDVDSLRFISSEADYVLGRVSTNRPEDVRETSVSIGVAATTWTTHLSQGLGNVSSDYADSKLPEKLSVIVNQPDYQSDKVIIPVVHSANGMDVRLVLTDTKGNKHIGRPRISSSAGELNSVQFEFKALESGVRYKLQEFQTRPFEWRTFDKVELQPKVSSNMGSTAFTPADVARKLMQGTDVHSSASASMPAGFN